MRLGLNMLHLVPGETGGSELYARRLVPALMAARPSLAPVIFASREGAPSLAAEPWAADAEVVELAFDARSRPRRVIAEQTSLPRAARRARVDLLHNLFTTAPALPGVPQLTTIQDLIYKRFPAAHRGVLARGMALLVPLAARRSRRLITYSEASKRDIVELLGIDAGRIDVALLGPGLMPGTQPVPEAELRARLELGDRPLVLSVSAKRAHKNIPRLIDAIASLDGSDAPVLVIPGYRTELEQELEAHARASGAGERVRFLGWVDDATLEGLYAAARCFAFPSLAEGFGLPVLEAMLRGTPVACSDATSIPEVGGDAVRYFDPTDTAAIAAALEELLTDAGLRERLAVAGRERAAEFTWERTAELTLASYDRVLAD